MYTSEQRAKYALPEDDQWLSERRLFEERISNFVTFPDPPKRLHEIASLLNGALAKCVAERRSITRYSGLPGRQLLHPVTMYSISPGASINGRGPALVRASKSTYRRAISVLNGLFKAAEDRGIEVVADVPRGLLRLQLEGADVRIAVRESVETKADCDFGKLNLVVSRRYGNERQLNCDPGCDEAAVASSVFNSLYLNVIERRQELRIEQAAKARRDEIATQMRKVEEERRQKAEEALIAQRRAFEEHAKVQALVELAENWEKAQLIRRYISALPPAVGETEIAWRAWADSVAKQLSSGTK